MLVARRYVVSGRVQGVGFRYFTVEAATREGLSGWVANRADGAVEALVEGDADAVERFEGKLKRGPRLARVADVHVEDDLPTGRADGFVIRS